MQRAFWRLGLAVALLALVLTGCYEVDLDVRVFPTGEALVTHTVTMPGAAFNMRLGSIRVTQTQLRNQLRELTEQDAAAVGNARVVDVAVQSGSDKARIVRRLIFDDASHIAPYLALFGLETEYKKGCFSRKLHVSAPTLDEEKLVRLGKYYEAQNTELPPNPQFKSNRRFALRIDLPGQVKKAEPAPRIDEAGLAWVVNGIDYQQPFDVSVKVKPRRQKTGVIGQAAVLDGDAIDRVLAALPADRSAAFTRRLGGRLTPILHVRLDKKARADLALLWSADAVSADAAAYHRAVDALVLPDLSTAYFPYLEVLEIDGQRIVAEGYRRRGPIPAAKLDGALRVAKKADEFEVSFSSPRVYAKTGDGAGTPDRVAAVIVVTFPSGAVGHRVITVRDLREGTVARVSGR